MLDFLILSAYNRKGDAARILGVSVQTLRRWDKEGKLKPVRIGKERRYREEDLLKFIGEDRPNAVAIYARVSSHDQRKDLEAQIEFLRRAVAGSFSQVYEVRDIASGLKGNRKGLLKLIDLAKTRKIRAVAVTYPYKIWF